MNDTACDVAINTNVSGLVVRKDTGYNFPSY